MTSLVHVEAVTTVTLALGLLVVDVLEPESGLHAALPEVSKTVSGHVEAG